MCKDGMRSTRLRWRLRSRWYWLMGRTFWRLYPPAVTKGYPACWWFRLRRGFPCSDQILREAWKASRRNV